MGGPGGGGRNFVDTADVNKSFPSCKQQVESKCTVNLSDVEKRAARCPQSVSWPKWSQATSSSLITWTTNRRSSVTRSGGSSRAAVLPCCDVCSSTNHVAEGCLSVDGVIGYKMVLRRSRQRLSRLVTDGHSAVSHRVALKGSTSAPFSTWWTLSRLFVEFKCFCCWLCNF